MKKLKCQEIRMVCKNCKSKWLVLIEEGKKYKVPLLCDDCGGRLVKKKFKDSPVYMGIGGYLPKYGLPFIPETQIREKKL